MAYPVFKAPQLQFKEKLQFSIPFAQDTLNTGAQNTLISDYLPFPFRIIEVKMLFGFTTGNLLRYYWLVSGNNTGSTTGIPTGDNPFAYSGTVPYFVGEGIIRKEPCRYKDDTGKKYIKLHAVNNSGVAQAVAASIVIQKV